MTEDGQPTDRCVIPHRTDPERPRRALEGLLVCAGHYGQLQRDLAELPDLHEDLALALHPENAWQRGVGQKVRGTAESARLNNARVEEARNCIRRDLASWSRLLVEDRELHLRPRNPEPAATAAFLAVHLDWLCAQPFVDEFAAEVLGLARTARALVYPSGRRTFPVGPCPEVTSCEVATQLEQRCTGRLRAILHGDEGSRVTDRLLPHSLDCSDCGTTIPADQWLSLGRRLPRPA